MAKINKLDCQKYFTVFDPNEENTGFTDIINRWYSLYQLGKMLGYKYVHTPLDCKTTPLVFNFLGLNKAFTININQFLNLNNFWINKVYKILDLVTLLDYKYSPISSGKIKFKKLRLITSKITKYLIKNLFFSQQNIIDISVEINDLKQDNIKTINDYVAFIQEKIAQISLDKETILIRFYLRLNSRKDYYALLYQDNKTNANELNLRSVYFKQREIEPIESKFTPDRVKLLIHLRLGDTAVIKTPWNTFISVFGSSQIFKEFDTPQKKFYADLIDVEDYFTFVQGLMSFVKEENFSFVVSSDGYKKAFSLIYENQDKLKFSPSQLEQIKQAEINYQKKFEMFKQLNNTKLIVGENDDNLNSFVHSILEANIIVTGFRNTLGLIPKFLNIYSDSHNPPIVIELYSRRKPYDREKLLGLTKNKAKFITVDINNIDYEYVVSQIKDTLAFTAGQKI
jgi:hypothetical protein